MAWCWVYMSCGLMGPVIVDRESPAASRSATTLEASSLVASAWGCGADGAGREGWSDGARPAVPRGKRWLWQVCHRWVEGRGHTWEDLEMGLQGQKGRRGEILNAGEIVRLQETKEKAIPPTCVCRKATQGRALRAAGRGEEVGSSFRGRAVSILSKVCSLRPTMPPTPEPPPSPARHNMEHTSTGT